MTLKFLSPVAILTFCTLLVISSPQAFSESKIMIFGWHADHWKNQDFQPLMMPPKHTHDRQWDFKENWSPDDWISQRGGAELMDGFFKSDILRDREVRKNIPVLVVGANFQRLSGYDKRRVADTVNAVYNITDNNGVGHFRLKDGPTGEWIGYYDSYGLRLR